MTLIYRVFLGHTMAVGVGTVDSHCLFSKKKTFNERLRFMILVCDTPVLAVYKLHFSAVRRLIHSITFDGNCSDSTVYAHSLEVRRGANIELSNENSSDSGKKQNASRRQRPDSDREAHRSVTTEILTGY